MANKRIEALEKLLAIKEETIKELERQVQLLKNQPPVVVPQIQPYQPLNPITVPNQPATPWQPNQPWWGTVIVSNGDSSNTFTVDPNTPFTLTNADGTSKLLNLNDIPRC
jgi:hypothetical protein